MAKPTAIKPGEVVHSANNILSPARPNHDEAWLAVENAKIRLECLKLARGEAPGFNNMIHTASQILEWVTG